jgi:hypothetical protein
MGGPKPGRHAKGFLYQPVKTVGLI